MRNIIENAMYLCGDQVCCYITSMSLDAMATQHVKCGMCACARSGGPARRDLKKTFCRVGFSKSRRVELFKEVCTVDQGFVLIKVSEKTQNRGSAVNIICTKLI